MFSTGVPPAMRNCRSWPHDLTSFCRRSSLNRTGSQRQSLPLSKPYLRPWSLLCRLLAYTQDMLFLRVLTCPIQLSKQQTRLQCQILLR